jgi:orotidine-5'-phosphate decarboxylase
VSDFVVRVAARPPLVLGVDPRPALHGPAPLAHIEAYTRELVDALGERIGAVKVQVAFFEALGVDGWALLHRLVDALDRTVPVICDAKRGDIGTTAEAYADAFLAAHPGTALTVNPYLGADAVEPFVVAAAAHGGALFVLVKTSNPGSGLFQDLELADGRRLYQAVADWVAEGAARHRVGGWSRVNAVVGATYPAQVEELRARLPDSLLLLPGLGAQGGGVTKGAGLLNAASRSLYYPGGSVDVAAAVAQADAYLADLAS